MLFGNVDNAANSPIYVAAQVNKSINTTNRDQLFGNVTADLYVTNAAVGVFGVSAQEQQALSANGAAGAHAGWVLRTVGTGLRAGRVFVETLVAGGSISDDASDDLVFQDYRVVIYSQPESNTTMGRGNTINMVVVANTVPVGASLTYYWQQDGGPGVRTWANVANAGTFASANGNTTFTLTIANNFIANGNVFRVIVGAAGANNVISTNALVQIVGS